MPILLDGFLDELHDRNISAVTDSRSSTLEADLDSAVFVPETEAALDANAPLPVQVACVTTAFVDLTARLSSLTESSPIEAFAEVERLFSTSTLARSLNRLIVQMRPITTSTRASRRS